MEVDDKLLKRINRQLRAIKVMLGFFSLLVIAMFAVLGFIAYKVATFTADVNDKITNIEQTTTEQVDIKAQLCEGATDSALTRQFCN